MVCNKQLSTGEELYIIDENKFVCKEDYLNSPSLKEGSLNSGTSGAACRIARGRIPAAAGTSRCAGKEVWLCGVRGCTPQPAQPPVIRGGREGLGVKASKAGGSFC